MVLDPYRTYSFYTDTGTDPAYIWVRIRIKDFTQIMDQKKIITGIENKN